MHVAVDVGGTFTDVSVLDEKTGRNTFAKVETVPSDPASGVLAGLAKAEVNPRDMAYFIHGTTLGINALLTRSGAHVAIITTKGFRDVYELGRTDREPMYDFMYRKPESLVPRSQVFEVEERVNFRGKVLTLFNQADASEVALSIKSLGVEAVAVCFLHSYANQQHELAMQQILEQICPDLPVTLSSDLSREFREYERTSTAVVNAYIQPITRSYLGELDHSLTKSGSSGRFLLTRSGGGVMTVASAQAEPVQLILSGPAAGVIGASALGQVIGVPDLISLDMGGTSLDTSLIHNGNPRLNHAQMFQGLPISKPTIDIHTIGAGGGSIAWVDPGGHLQVGPRSAGSVPGPVCYGKGGDQITVTDAALAVGYLDPGNFLGGELSLQTAQTHALLGELATQTNLSPMDVAHGILRISTVKIAGAVREISVEQGHHPADFSLFAFGGGGPLLACDVARELGLPRVIVPPGAANFSAFGMLMVDVVHDFAQTYVSGTDSMQLDAVNHIRASLVEEGQAALDADDIPTGARLLEQFAEMRYTGQEHAVTLPLTDAPLTPDDVPGLVEKFNQVHRQQYGHAMDDPMEIVTLRLKATGLLPRPDIPELTRSNISDPEPVGFRTIAGSSEPYSVFKRSALTEGSRLDGPTIVEEPTCTTVLHAGDALTVGRFGELHVVVA